MKCLSCGSNKTITTAIDNLYIERVDYIIKDKFNTLGTGAIAASVAKTNTGKPSTSMEKHFNNLCHFSVE